jgi:predicted aminopeptidase
MKKTWRVVAFCSAVALIGGCSQLGYFVQAAHGQFSLLSEARPIDEWIADPAVADKLKDKLNKVREIRRFAAQELGLPDNGTFTTYADVKRPFVMWNVVATPELSLDPIQWCFPVAGCVNYRGYYSKEEAQGYASGLRDERYDVQVGGVPAYSTLGYFNDPVLSTFIQYPEGELARLVFHELAHQVAYAPGDSRFNESFAVAVEEAGVERWMAAHGDEKMRKAYADYEARKHDFLALLLKCRNALQANYESGASNDDKRKQKTVIFQELQAEYQSLKTSWGGYTGYDRWFSEPLSNAHLSAIATYHDFVPGFRAMLAREKTFSRFYTEVRKLAALDKSERKTRLTRLAQSDPATIRSADASMSR